GDYEVTAAVYDSKSGEHNVKRTKFHVGEPFRDPLRRAWVGLPTVELSSCGPRDSAHLALALETQKPVSIDVVAVRAINPRVPYFIQPRLDVLAEMAVPNGSMLFTVLDLQSRKILTEKASGGVLDQRRLWGNFPKNARNIIDVHELENLQSAQFFV